MKEEGNDYRVLLPGTAHTEQRNPAAILGRGRGGIHFWTWKTISEYQYIAPHFGGDPEVDHSEVNILYRIEEALALWMSTKPIA